MITRSKAEKNSVALNETQQLEEDKKEKMEQKMKIPSFTGEGQLKIQNWLKLFEKFTEDKPSERQKIVLEYLTEKALNYFIEQDMFEESWANIKIKLTNYFEDEKTVSSQQFLNLKLENCQDFEEYFRKKTDAARKLKVDDTFLIEILNNGLPIQQKILNFTKTCVTIHDWYQFNKDLYYNLKEENAGQSQQRRPSDWKQQQKMPFVMPQMNQGPRPMQFYYQKPRYTGNYYNRPGQYQNERQFPQPRNFNHVPYVPRQNFDTRTPYNVRNEKDAQRTYPKTGEM